MDKTIRKVFGQGDLGIFIIEDMIFFIGAHTVGVIELKAISG